jgi:hypothetical protein
MEHARLLVRSATDVGCRNGCGHLSGGRTDRQQTRTHAVGGGAVGGKESTDLLQHTVSTIDAPGGRSWLSCILLTGPCRSGVAEKVFFLLSLDQARLSSCDTTNLVLGEIRLSCRSGAETHKLANVLWHSIYNNHRHIRPGPVEGCAVQPLPPAQPVRQSGLLSPFTAFYR